MIITFTRKWYTSKSTIGKVTINGDSAGMFSLEDVARLFKVPGHTAIPAGRYLANITYSSRFGRYMLELQKVPGFSYIRVHSGNTDEDTDGCPLVGTSRGVDAIYNSVAAYTVLWERIHEYIRDAMKHIEPIWIEVIDTQKPKLI